MVLTDKRLEQIVGRPATEIEALLAKALIMQREVTRAMIAHEREFFRLHRCKPKANCLACKYFDSIEEDAEDGSK